MSIVNLFGGTIIVVSVFSQGLPPLASGWLLALAELGKLLLAAFLIAHSVRNLRALARGTDGQHG